MEVLRKSPRASLQDFVILHQLKTYTLASESIYLLIFGVPKLDLRSELKNLCQKYGQVIGISVCNEYMLEDFTECFKIKFQRIQSSRIAKRMIDTKNFYGGSLHVCYAPEYETVDELRDKIKQRKLEVNKRIKWNELEKYKNLRSQQNNENLQQNELDGSNGNLLDNLSTSEFNSSSPHGNDNYTNPDNVQQTYEDVSINSLNNSVIPQSNKTIAKGPQNNHFSCSNLEKFHRVDETQNTMFNNSNNIFQKSDEINYKSAKNVDTRHKNESSKYVFKRKRKDKELINKIQKLENALSNEKPIASQFNVANINITKANYGRVVVCDIDSKIDKNRIFSAPKRNVQNKIIINLEKQ